MRKYISILVLLFGVMGEVVVKAQVTRTSISGSNLLWSNASTWTDGVVPSALDNVVIANGAIVFLDEDAEINNLDIGTSNNATTARLIISDGSVLTVNGLCDIRRGSSGEYATYVKSIVIGSLSYELMYDEVEDEEVTVEVLGTGIGAKVIIKKDLTIRGNDNNNLSGIRMIGAAQLELKGNMILPQNGGFLDAPSTSIVTLSGIASPQQIYMGSPTAIKFPNLIIDGDSVHVYASVGAGEILGELRINSGAFDNSGKTISVGADIVIEENGSFYMTGPSTISVTTATALSIYGKLVAEHRFGLGAFQTPGTIHFGANTEIEFAGNVTSQVTGFLNVPEGHVFNKLTFKNIHGTTLDKNVNVANLEIMSGAIFLGSEEDGTPYEILVKNTWINNGTFTGNRGTVRLETGDIVDFKGDGVNDFRNLLIDGNTTLSAPELLTITGNFIISPGSSFLHNNNSVMFNSNGSGNGATTSGVGQFNNVTVNRGLVFAGNDTINGVLYLQNGISDIVGSLTLDLNTGYIDPAGNAVLNGDISFIKSASKKGYTAVSLPVASVVSDLKNAGFQYVLKYDDKAAPNYLVPLSNTTMLAADGRAYACHADATNSSNPEIRLTGSYNNARSSVSVPVVSTPVNGQFVAGYTGWNLIGNPFAFDVDWDELLQIAGNSSIYPGVYYQMGDYFQSYIAGVPATGDYNRLGPMQGVMVYLPNAGTTPINNTFTFSKDAGLGGSNILRRKAQPSNVLKLNVSNGQYSDATYVRLSDEATIDFDPTMDAYKFRNGGSLPSFFSYREGVNYSINSVPATFANYSMLLAFEPKVAGSYTITLSEEYLFDLPYEIYLEDKVLNILHPIGSERSYTFTTNLGERAGRFALHFENAVITAMEGAAFSFVRVFSEGRDVMLTGAADVEGVAEIKLYDITGRMVARYGEVDLNNKSFNFKVSNPSGVYIVSVVAGERVYSERIVIY